MSRYFAQVQFVKGKMSLIETVESEWMSIRELKIINAVDAMAVKGWTALTVTRSLDKPVEHVVDEIGVQMALDVDELVSGK